MAVFFQKKTNRKLTQFIIIRVLMVTDEMKVCQKTWVYSYWTFQIFFFKLLLQMYFYTRDWQSRCTLQWSHYHGHSNDLSFKQNKIHVPVKRRWHFQHIQTFLLSRNKCIVEYLPSSISGGNPPTKTFLENLSMRSRPDCELGDPLDGELMFGTVWSSDPSSSKFASSANPNGDFPSK